MLNIYEGIKKSIIILKKEKKSFKIIKRNKYKWKSRKWIEDKIYNISLYKNSVKNKNKIKNK